LTEGKEQLETQIRNAEELHGHLGPFLVIGVRIGMLAHQVLGCEDLHNGRVLAHVKVPLRTPFSCTLDGIQSTTHCTVGNRRLRVGKSATGITTQFKATNSNKTLTITVKPGIIKELTNRLSRNETNEVLAETIASAPDSHIFKFKFAENRPPTKHSE
jgi:formylmethanofuran dehydrogenase subunit E